MRILTVLSARSAYFTGKRREWLTMILKEIEGGPFLHLLLNVIFFLAILAFQARAFTDPFDVTALQDLYRTLNYPPVLKGWRLEEGDPCEQSWTGVTCCGSSVIYLKLHGLNLTGYLGSQLYNLHNLKQVDISSNNILGPISYSLPPNATHINLACNQLTQNIPYSFSLMTNLQHLNLSHNMLSGDVGNVFTGLQKLREMDLSYNNFTGDLPSSFESLTNLSGLYLQNNKFTGSVMYLAELPLTNLNIQGNYFSGIIPRHFQSIPNLWIGGNKFYLSDNSPPWDIPLQTLPIEPNISSPPTTESITIENHPSMKKLDSHKKKKMGAGRITFLVGGGTLLVTCTMLYLIVQLNRYRAQRLQILGRDYGSSHSLPLSRGKDGLLSAPEGSPQILNHRSPILGTSRTPPIYNSRIDKTSKRKSFSKNCKFSSKAKRFTVSELQLATNSFSEENLLGEGSLGSVYKAKFPDGQTLAVKNINIIKLFFDERFLDVIRTASCLKHPNIISLVGYCLEYGQHLLVYEYVQNLSLDDALHSRSYKPLSWGVRLKIAVGIAQALNYMHTVSPPIAHCNLKAANILLDEELKPHICDCGLAILRPLASNTLKFKASKLAIGDTGYAAPENGESVVDNTKVDIYAFGVLLLELLTGREPFDHSKPIQEQSLVKWASSRLHDSESLEQMVDPCIKRTFSLRALSRFADIVSLCIQPVKEFRPPMSEVLESLKSLSQRLTKVKIGGADGAGIEPFERSFHSTKSRFMGSPTNCFLSV